MTTISVLIGKRISELRKSKGIKQVTLANIVDIEPTNLSKIEKGVHFPKEETLIKISNALDIDMHELFTFNHIMTKDELLFNINKILSQAQIEDLQFFYRTLVAYNESKFQS